MSFDLDALLDTSTLGARDAEPVGQEAQEPDIPAPSVSAPAVQWGWARGRGEAQEVQAAQAAQEPSTPTTTTAPTTNIIIHTGPSPHSGHKIDKLLACPQRYAYAELLQAVDAPNRDDGPRTDESPALVKGSLGHAWLAQHYARRLQEQEGKGPERFAPPDDAIEHHAAKGGHWLDFAALAKRTGREYVAEYLQTDRHLKVAGVEHTLSAKIGPEQYDHTRSADLIVIGADGLIYIIDHKFVGYLRDSTITRYALDGQFLDYELIGRSLWGLASAGGRFGGVYLNLIQWGRWKRSKATGQEEYVPPKFLRTRVPPAPWALRYRIDVLREGYGLKTRLLAEGRDPWDWPKKLTASVCNTPFGQCKGYDLCRFGPTASPGHSRLKVEI